MSRPGPRDPSVDPTVEPNHGAALMMDLYEMTMAAGYIHRDIHEKQVTFELFVRKMPPHRNYLVFAGLDRIRDYLTGLRFTEKDLAYLSRPDVLADALTDEVRQAFSEFRFRADVWALPEGTVFFPNEPIVRVTGRLFEVQLVETFLLSVVNSESLVASKASRIAQAAGPADVLEFGSRRTSPEEAVRTARAAYLAGFSATSNLEAGRRFGIPVSGTAAHSWTMAFEDEVEAFRAYVQTYGPQASTLLVDTYDTLEGVTNAIKAGGKDLKSIRLDSGDLLALSKKSRRLLDASGLQKTSIVASGDLDESSIATLRILGAPIDAWGVGTGLVRSIDAPYLPGVYKMVYDHALDRPVVKTSDDKATLPGPHQTYRRTASDRRFIEDVLTLADEDEEGTPLLEPLLRNGRPASPRSDLHVTRKRHADQVRRLPDSTRRLDPDPTPYEVRVSAKVRQLAADSTAQRR